MLKLSFLDQARRALEPRLILESRLQGVNGFTGRGDIEISSWRSGVRKMGVGLTGIAGLNADIFIDGAHCQTIPLENGAVHFTANTSRGDNVPDITTGAQIEIRQNGEAILGGTLSPKKPYRLRLPRRIASLFRWKA